MIRGMERVENFENYKKEERKMAEDFGKLAVLDMGREEPSVTLKNIDSIEEVYEERDAIIFSQDTGIMIRQMYKYLHANYFIDSFEITVFFANITRYSDLDFSDEEEAEFEERMNKILAEHDFDIFVAATSTFYQIRLLAEWADKHNKIFFTSAHKMLDLSKYKNVFAFPSGRLEGWTAAKLAAKVSYVLQDDCCEDEILFTDIFRMTNGESMLDALKRVKKEKENK